MTILQNHVASQLQVKSNNISIASAKKQDNFIFSLITSEHIITCHVQNSFLSQNLILIITQVAWGGGGINLMRKKEDKTI